MKTISRTAKLIDKVCGFVYWLVMIVMVISIFGAVFLGINVCLGAPLLRDNQSYLLPLGSLELLMAPRCASGGHCRWQCPSHHRSVCPRPPLL